MTRPQASPRLATLSLIAALAVLLVSPTILLSQSTISTGNINGLVTDATDAAVPNAKVTIKRIDTGVTTNVTSNNSGFYNSGSITPGTYLVRVEAKGFESSETQVDRQDRQQ